MSDIALTWPKTRPLDSYLDELTKAVKEDKAICYRVPQLPRRGATRGARVYMIHDGTVRGWTEWITAEYVATTVTNPHNGLTLVPGNYIIRRAEWNRLLTPIDMAGFRGFRGFRYAPKWWRERVSVG